MDILDALGIAARSAMAVGLRQIAIVCEDAATEIILLRKKAGVPIKSDGA